MNAAVLKVEKLQLSFGAIKALDDVSLEVHPGEILAVVGPNGAGKSSLLNSISGFYRPNEGRIQFEETDIIGLRPNMVARLGVARTFQNIQLYLGMSVADNLLAGRHIHSRGGLLQAVLRPWGMRDEVRQRQAVEEVLRFLELQPHRHVPVGTFGYGIRKRVDLGRALAMEPRILLLDEPMAGMTMDEKEDMVRFILQLRRQRRLPIVLVEHDMQVISDIADRVVVLDWGKHVAEGRPDDVLRRPEVVSAYLGGE
ncbi:branched-chain amino acid transport system ATP-binding protein [Rhodoligotrophos appendicifer]|uniref:ABC transporter ATP-binding protein n=1 Tax=Rhodoligotrophos appendicifer TaxID=987056 RepID=UPI001186FE9F|nr:ABC transporter ATP-binding protein [Rhodoligotrophos appendicifer]